LKEIANDYQPGYQNGYSEFGLPLTGHFKFGQYASPDCGRRRSKLKATNIVFGIYKMDTTQKNLQANKNAWVIAAVTDGVPKG
jgi:hypothetical protein